MLAHGKMRTNAEQINLYTYFCKPNNFLTMAIETSYPRDFLPHSPLPVAMFYSRVLLFARNVRVYIVVRSMNVT